MEPIQITITAFGVTHSLPPLDATVAAAWMGAQGIDLTDPKSALEKASLLIIRPIIAQGIQAKKHAANDALAAEEAEILRAFVVAEPAQEE